jgi:predicted transcriptional regulator of viral defense system
MGILARRELWDVGVDQHGYITLDDAERLGISQPTVAMLAHRGTLEHLARGVYRFVDFPTSPAGPYLEAVLWTGQSQACLSHDTALALHELCDINPGRIHVTVPKGRRLRRAGGNLYVVHQQELDDEQIGWWERVRIVTVGMAIEQCIDSGVPTYLVKQALETAARRGAVRSGDLDRLSATLGARNG